MRVPVSSAAGVTLDAATNPYLPFPSEILGIVRHTAKEYSFRMAFSGEVRPGQFFEVSIPKFGEAPISVTELADAVQDALVNAKSQSIPVIGFGPGAEAQAHAPNEVTWKKDLVTCAAFYAALPQYYCD